MVDRETGRNCVLEALNVTKFWEPHSDILSRSELTVEAMRVWESVRSAREQGESKAEEMCRVESSAKACIREEVELRRSLMNSRKRVGERTEPCGTPLKTGKGSEVAPSTTTDMKRLDK